MSFAGYCSLKLSRGSARVRVFAYHAPLLVRWMNRRMETKRRGREKRKPQSGPIPGSRGSRMWVGGVVVRPLPAGCCCFSCPGTGIPSLRPLAEAPIDGPDPSIDRVIEVIHY
jgi:hypothetical protein